MAETYTMTVRIPLPDLAKLDRLAKQNHRTRANMVRFLVAEAAMTGAKDVQLADVETSA